MNLIECSAYYTWHENNSRHEKQNLVDSIKSYLHAFLLDNSYLINN